ncbi:hypothetical protein YC2023_097121 [Brassica napus]
MFAVLGKSRLLGLREEPDLVFHLQIYGDSLTAMAHGPELFNGGGLWFVSSSYRRQHDTKTHVDGVSFVGGRIEAHHTITVDNNVSRASPLETWVSGIIWLSSLRLALFSRLCMVSVVAKDWKPYLASVVVGSLLIRNAFVVEINQRGLFVWRCLGGFFLGVKWTSKSAFKPYPKVDWILKCFPAPLWAQAAPSWAQVAFPLVTVTRIITTTAKPLSSTTSENV